MLHLNRNESLVLLVISCLAITVTLGQVTAPQLLVEMIRPIRFNIMRHRAEIRAMEQSIDNNNNVNHNNNLNYQNPPSQHSTGTKIRISNDQTIQNKQQQIETSSSNNRDSTQAPFRVSLTSNGEHHSLGRHAKLEHVFNTLDRLAYTISKPAVILNAIRLFSMVISSVFMSIFMIPTTGSGNAHYHHQQESHQTSATRRRGKAIWNNILDQLNRSDVEGMIELITRNYDENLERESLMEKLLCRDRYRRSRRR